jgi:hypothetical protein
VLQVIVDPILENFPDVVKLDGIPYSEKWDGDTVTELITPEIWTPKSLST